MGGPGSSVRDLPASLGCAHLQGGPGAAAQGPQSMQRELSGGGLPGSPGVWGPGAPSHRPGNACLSICFSINNRLRKLLADSEAASAGEAPYLMGTPPGPGFPACPSTGRGGWEVRLGTLTLPPHSHPRARKPPKTIGPLKSRGAGL